MPLTNYLTEDEKHTDATLVNRLKDINDEVARLAELGCARAVIAQTRRIKCMMHILGKTDQTAGFVNLVANVFGHAQAVRGAFCVRLRKR